MAFNQALLPRNLMARKEEVPEWVDKIYQRWRKRTFANDDIRCQPSRDNVGCWDIIITRGNYEACLTFNPQIYGHLEQDLELLLKADEEMRFALKAIKERVKEKE